jgi:hypothetical protein
VGPNSGNQAVLNAEILQLAAAQPRTLKVDRRKQSGPRIFLVEAYEKYVEYWNAKLK